MGLSPCRPLDALISQGVEWGSQLLRSWYGESWSHAGQQGTSISQGFPQAENPVQLMMTTTLPPFPPGLTH